MELFRKGRVLVKNVILMAGPNGAGKTTFALEYLRDHDYEYISADEIAQKLVSRSEDLNKVKVKAGRLFFQEISRLIEAEKDFVVEVTLAGRGFQRIIRRLKDAGYAVTIIFLFLESPDVCVARVKKRVMAGGHNVPEEDIVRRFYRSKDNFWNIYRDQVDRWHLFYNSEAHAQEVAFGKGIRFTVIDEGRFGSFMRDIEDRG